MTRCQHVHEIEHGNEVPRCRRISRTPNSRERSANNHFIRFIISIQSVSMSKQQLEDVGHNQQTRLISNVPCLRRIRITLVPCWLNTRAIGFGIVAAGTARALCVVAHDTRSGALRIGGATVFDGKARNPLPSFQHRSTRLFKGRCWLRTLRRVHKPGRDDLG